MSKFTINDSANLTAAETEKLQATFKEFEERAEKLKPLSEQIEKYFDELYTLGDDMNNAFGSYEIDYGDREFYANVDNPVAGAAYTFDFWIPSSMEC